jgi:hypothetical protein
MELLVGDVSAGRRHCRQVGADFSLSRLGLVIRRSPARDEPLVGHGANPVQVPLDGGQQVILAGNRAAAGRCSPLLSQPIHNDGGLAQAAVQQ